MVVARLMIVLAFPRLFLPCPQAVTSDLFSWRTAANSQRQKKTFTPEPRNTASQSHGLYLRLV